MSWQWQVVDRSLIQPEMVNSYNLRSNVVLGYYLNEDLRSGAGT